MVKYLNNKIELTQEQIEEMELNQWIWNSHFWEETHHGYYTCKNCGTNWTNEIPLIKETANLCLKNPIIAISISK